MPQIMPFEDGCFWVYAKMVAKKLGDRRVIKYIEVVYSFYSSGRDSGSCVEFIDSQIEGK